MWFWRKTTTAACLGVGFALTALGVSSADPKAGPEPCYCSATTEVTEWKGFTVRTFSCEPHASEAWRMEVRRGEESLTLQAGHRLTVGGDDAPAVGTDVTGDGNADLVVREWTGGVHGVYKHHVYQLEPEFAFLGTVEAGHSEGAGFRDVDGDGRLEFESQDWTFVLWRDYPYADAPAPRVALRWRDGDFRLAHDAMIQPLAPEDSRARRAAQLQLEAAWGEQSDPPAALVGEVLDLIYAGHPAEAWELLAAAWPEGRPGCEAFALDLLGQLSQSPYWLDLDVSTRR